MKNALDEIKCVPVLGGMKPPYQISSHPYCIDIITSYVQLSKFEFKTKSEFLKRIEDNIRYYCQSNNIDFHFHFDNKYPLTIPPSVNNLQWFLAIQIISFDINKIKSLLSFQQKRFTEDETDFITFIEFAVYNLVRNISQLDNKEHLRILMEWVNGQRALNTHSGNDNLPSKVFEPLKSNKTAKQTKGKLTLPSFTLLAFKIDSKYFIKNANDILEAFKLLKGGGFISLDTDYEHFKAILQGKTIKYENRIDWTGKYIDLNIFVLLLLKNKISPIKTNKWETTTNCFIKESQPIPSIKIRKAKGKKDNEDKLIAIVNLI